MRKMIVRLMSLILGAACLSGCTDTEAFIQKSCTSDEEKITEVCIDVQDRKIEVMLSSDNQKEIEFLKRS